MKGKEPEGRLIELMPTEKLKKSFQETLKNYLKGTFKEKTLSKEEMNQLLVRTRPEVVNRCDKPKTVKQFHTLIIKSLYWASCALIGHQVFSLVIKSTY